MNSARTSARDRRGGFTLVELVVATVMIAILVTSTYVAVSSTVRARSSGEARVQAMSRASAAAEVIARDLRSTLRAADLVESKVLITRAGAAGRGQDGLLIFTHAGEPVRAFSAQAEGAEVEAQYRLEAGARAGQLALWGRRQAVPDEYPDAGGVARVMVDGVTALTFDAYDGEAWRDAWDSDSDGLPHAVRVVVTATSDDGTQTASARRVVAMDRVPLPLNFSEDTGDQTEPTAAAGGVR